MTQVATTGVTAEIKKALSTGLTYEQLQEQFARLFNAVAAEAEPAAPQAELKPVVLSEVETKALRGLPVEASTLATPAEPRALTPEEISEFVPLLHRAKLARAAAERVEQRLVEAFHGHIDAGLPDDLPRDKKGHKLAAGEVVTDYAQKVVRDLKGGSLVPPTDATLQELEEAGVITHAEYLRVTHAVPTREIVPTALMALIQKRPELVDALAERAQFTGQTVSVRLAKNS